MKLVIGRNSLEVIPEGVLEEVYIEEVLDLKYCGDYCKLTRTSKTGEYLAARTLPAPLAKAFDELYESVAAEKNIYTKFAIHKLFNSLRNYTTDADYINVARLALILHSIHEISSESP